MYHDLSRLRRKETRMATTELRIELPQSLSEDEAKLLLAVKLFEVGKVSLGQAAKMAELSKRAFMEILGRYGVPVFNYNPDELRREVDS
jgi:predicted HTH domain antitoxin